MYDGCDLGRGLSNVTRRALPGRRLQSIALETLSCRPARDTHCRVLTVPQASNRLARIAGPV